MKKEELMNIENIIKIIKFLKPKFYNKLTWVVVIFGISLMASPFWQQILSKILEEKFQITIGSQSDVIWGYALIFTGLVYNILTQYFLEFAEHKSSNNQCSQILNLTRAGGAYMDFEHDEPIRLKKDDVLKVTPAYDEVGNSVVYLHNGDRYNVTETVDEVNKLINIH